jgi:hypothetical protein
MPLLGMTVTSASRKLSHYLNLSIDLVMLVSVLIFIWYEARTKRRVYNHTIFGVYGPALLVSLASILIMADPIRHVLQDLNLIDAPMYKSKCHAETFSCLSIIGWFFTIFCTYFGFTLFFIGVLWNSNTFVKVVTKWRALRGDGN